MKTRTESQSRFSRTAKDGMPRRRHFSEQRVADWGIPDVECLEIRSLLSVGAVGGFNQGGSSLGNPGGTFPWAIGVSVDGEAVVPFEYEESGGETDKAPTVQLSSPEPTWIAGVIGDGPLDDLTA